MTRKFTRRRALKMISASVAAAALSPTFHARARYPTVYEPSEDLDLWTWMGRARVIRHIMST